MKKSARLAAILLVALAILSPSPSNGEDPSKAAPLKIGFLCVGPISDWGYNYKHNEGRLFIEKQLKGKVETTIAENIPESAEAERVMEKMIAKGNRLIFSTSYGYFEPALKVAARHPDVFIEQCGRVDLTTKNLATYFVKQWDAMYLCGVVAGSMTKANNIGFVAAHPVPPVLQNINAFTLGARSVNPKVKVHIVWTNKWSDPALEAEAAKGLIESGADLLAESLDSPITVVQTAEKSKVYCVGYHADVSQFAPHSWLTGAMWDWGPFYVKIANSVIDRTWKDGNDRFDMKDGYVKLSSFGAAVPKSLQTKVLALKKDIEAGKVVVFQGPLSNRDGKLLVAKGQAADLKFIEQMNWLVPGAEGSLPTK